VVAATEHTDLAVWAEEAAVSQPLAAAEGRWMAVAEEAESIG